MTCNLRILWSLTPCKLGVSPSDKSGSYSGQTIVTDVMILNYAVGLDVARVGPNLKTQGVWPCKLPIDSLPLQILAKSPKLMSDLSKQSRRNFPNAVAGFTNRGIVAFNFSPRNLTQVTSAMKSV